MSNTSIILRLETKLADYSSEKIGKYDFTKFLIDSIEALENIDYETIQKARDFEYKFEVADFIDDDPEIEGIEKVTEDFKKWLTELK